MRKITPTTVPVAQFVNVAPRWVTLGWRDSDGHLGQVSTFNRSALGKHGTVACGIPSSISSWPDSFHGACPHPCGDLALLVSNGLQIDRGRVHAGMTEPALHQIKGDA